MMFRSLTTTVFRSSVLLLLSQQISNSDFVVTAATATEKAFPSSTCAYGFTVCSPSGGSEGVDFRSHFAVYAASHNLSGWVRNGCDKCVYGMFAGGLVSSSSSVTTASSCDNAHTLVDVMKDDSRIVKELDSKASGLIATITNITGYPNNLEMMCPSNVDGNKILPEGYIKPTYAVVDWSFSNDGCKTPCGCIPTAPVKDCQGTDSLQVGADYTLGCQRYPLGADTKHFPDCNSIYVHNNVSCWKIDDGLIVSSGLCGDDIDINGDGGGSGNYDWVNDTLAAQCCGPWVATYKYGRTGLSPPPLKNCTTYDHESNQYNNKCIPKTKSDNEEL